MVDESVGQSFQTDLLIRARDKTLQVINEAASQMKPGMSEADAKSIIAQIQKEKGAPKNWHPPQIRFGENTLLAFGEKSDASIILQKNDIFFFDLGPLFENHEGDVGRTFCVGSDPEMERCQSDVELIWNEVRDHCKKNIVTGQALYNFAEKCALDKAWNLSLKGASGHRVADFPHTAKRRGQVRKLDFKPVENRWILEIQIQHPRQSFGAFYEDILK